MKRMLVLLAAAALALSANAAEWTIKLGHISNTEHTWHRGSMKFKELVEAKTNGRVAVEVYPNNEIGTEAEVIDAIYSGVAHMVISSDTMANWVPEIKVMGVPYMIRDLDHMKKVLDSDFSKFLEKKLIEKAAMRPLAVFIRSPRNVTSNFPITKPADMKDFKIRLPNVPLHVVAWEAVGAKPIPMAFAEVFTSIQQKVIDGQENPPDLIRSASLFEVQKYMVKTEHLLAWIYLLIGEDFFQTLPKDIQDIIIECGKEAEAYERKIHFEDEEANLKYLLDHGMEFIEPDKKAFADAMREPVFNALDKNLQELYKMAADL